MGTAVPAAVFILQLHPRAAPSWSPSPWSGLPAWPTDSKKSLTSLVPFSYTKKPVLNTNPEVVLEFSTLLYGLLGFLLREGPQRLGFQPNHAILRRYCRPLKTTCIKTVSHNDGKCPKQCSVSEVVHVHKGNPVVIMLQKEPQPHHSLDICFCSFLCPDFLLYKINSSKIGPQVLSILNSLWLLNTCCIFFSSLQQELDFRDVTHPDVHSGGKWIQSPWYTHPRHLWRLLCRGQGEPACPAQSWGGGAGMQQLLL